MEKCGGKNKKGFTVIEVVLVLAIAGAIFLMVFLGLPALQRSSRDAKRREDMTAFLEAVKDYQSANRGALPTDEGTVDMSEEIETKSSTWRKFYEDYLGNDFVDPSNDDPYTLNVVVCKGSTGSPCEDLSDPAEFQILVVKQASCNNGQAIKSSNVRRIAILYNMEVTGSFCGNS